jgi:hypothetical protein
MFFKEVSRFKELLVFAGDLIIKRLFGGLGVEVEIVPIKALIIKYEVQDGKVTTEELPCLLEHLPDGLQVLGVLPTL